MRRALEQVKKPDHWPRDFAKSIKERQTALLEELEVKSQAMYVVCPRTSPASPYPADHLPLPSTTGEQQFKTQFRTSIAAVLDTESTSALQPLKIAHISPTPEALYLKSSILLDESQNLLTQYHQLAHQPSAPSRLTGLAKKFAADRDQIAQAIAAARKVADADIDDMLADRLHEVRSRKATITAADETLGKEILRLGRNQRPELAELDPEGWGNVAYRAQRAVEKLYKVTVMEE